MQKFAQQDLISSFRNVSSSIYELLGRREDLLQAALPKTCLLEVFEQIVEVPFSCCCCCPGLLSCCDTSVVTNGEAGSFRFGFSAGRTKTVLCMQIMMQAIVTIRHLMRCRCDSLHVMWCDGLWQTWLHNSFCACQQMLPACPAKLVVDSRVRFIAGNYV